MATVTLWLITISSDQPIHDIAMRLSAEGLTVREVLAAGAKKAVVAATHPVLSGAAIDNITKSQLDELVVTDTIPLSEAAKACGMSCEGAHSSNVLTGLG